MGTPSESVKSIAPSQGDIHASLDAGLQAMVRTIHSTTDKDNAEMRAMRQMMMEMMYQLVNRSMEFGARRS
ncbi:unnamed protein product [Linum trigynum]|uniref:Uncharacterized protein n=1 Tax=Linum trigynum TaxID=586398 RepID=A0AAV2E0N8_9ROSI